MMPEGRVEIRPVRESDAASFCAAVRSVAAEKWYLATVEGFSFEETSAFVKHNVENTLPQVMAVVENQVVGFCDILPGSMVGFTHVGRMGMGVLAGWRGQGIGRRMISACLELARRFGIEKVELEVFADNIAAIRLYAPFGFADEGVKIRGRKLDERYQDIRLMALWL
jgi:RimJ/RimL family protein N-acetyltransferase